MGIKFYCVNCGDIFVESVDLDTPFVAKDHVPCIKCGASEVRGEVSVEESAPVMYDSVSITARDAEGVVMKMKAGGSRSADGTIAQIEQVVHKRNRTYKKKVTLFDGKVIKDVEGPLDDQSLHGPQRGE